MNNCTACHGLIMEPNVAYGYAGKVCHCKQPLVTEQFTGRKQVLVDTPHQPTEAPVAEVFGEK